jgi:hypothetical protein
MHNYKGLRIGKVIMSEADVMLHSYGVPGKPKKAAASVDPVVENCQPVQVVEQADETVKDIKYGLVELAETNQPEDGEPVVESTTEQEESVDPVPEEAAVEVKSPPAKAKPKSKFARKTKP